MRLTDSRLALCFSLFACLTLCVGAGCTPNENTKKQSAASAADKADTNTDTPGGAAKADDETNSPVDATEASSHPTEVVGGPSTSSADSAGASAESTPSESPRPSDESTPSESPPPADESIAGRADNQSNMKQDQKEAAPLIPRQVLFGNPERASARVSPDGRHLSFLAPVDGVLNVWVAPIDDLAAAKPVTQDKIRGIRGHSWAYDGKHILYSQDQGGDEDWHVYATDVEQGTTKDLTPVKNVNARIVEISDRFPGEILVGLNDRNPQFHDVYRVNIATGERTLVRENPSFAALMADDDFKIRFAITFTAEGGQLILKPEGENEWKPFLRIDPADTMTTSPAGFNKEGDVLYLLDSRDRNTAALMAIDLKTNESKLVAEDARADIDDVLTHPTEKTIQAVSFTYDRKKWKVLDEAIAGDLEYLQSVEDGELVVTSRTLDDTLWTVAYILDDGPVKFYLYDRSAKKARYLFSSRRDLDEYPLVKMSALILKSRDGLDLISYLSLPPGSDPDGDGRPDHPVPMVLFVHGGPWSRDTWGFDATHQWLANRGYAVLSVNYRGSTGFGKNFINAANGQWSLKMHDDLIDAVDWAVDQGVADREKIAIMGGSYGGYATLVGLTFTPEVFRCGVDIVGPSSLVTLLQNAPRYWMPFMPVMKDRVGDYESEEGQKKLLERSPLTKVDAIRRPLLIGQGANDPRVTQVEADQIVKAMQEKNIPVTYVLFPDEGHGFIRPENRMAFNAVVEAFLSVHLGGRYEPVGEDFEGASITVPTGASAVPGLKEALK